MKSKYIVEIEENDRTVKVPFESEKMAFEFAAQMSKSYKVKFYHQ